MQITLHFLDNQKKIVLKIQVVLFMLSRFLNSLMKIVSLHRINLFRNAKHLFRRETVDMYLFQQ